MKYMVPYALSGVATVEAETPEEAQEMVDEGLEWWSGDIDWESNRLDGSEVGVPYTQDDEDHEES